MTTTWHLSGVPEVLGERELVATGEHLASLQLANGLIPWFEGGHADPWNHVEAAMALTVTGHLDAARAAYRWLAQSQLAEGAWFNYYLAERVKDARLDTNVVAYVATGLWHYLLVTGDVDFTAEIAPSMARALDFVVAHQFSDGTIRWSLDAQGRHEGYALLTGSSSIHHALCSGLMVMERLGEDRPHWREAAGRLAHAVARHPGAFAPKNEFAMDWYYPILAGALRDEGAARRIADGWERHVIDGLGVRCVSTSDWVTAAETAECVLALDAMGETSRALDLFAATTRHRRSDGSYVTGLAYPDAVTFPAGETTSYTAAAVVLAADALTSSTPGAALFRHEFHRGVPEIAEAGCPLVSAPAQGA